MTGLLKKGSKGDFVQLLQEMLYKLSYTISIDGVFGSGTEMAVIDFQKKNNLKIDGMVGAKTWILLQQQSAVVKQVDPEIVINQFLSELDFITFATKYNLEVAAIKAVHEVESNGRGFLNGKIKILFEGHVFWAQLLKRNINPVPLQKDNEDILYKKYFTPNPYYKLDQHSRLNKALKINAEAAYSSASYGLFQVMGFHYSAMNFATAKAFVDFISVNEANQLDIFGRFIEANNLLKFLRNHDWVNFALKYNGKAYKTNKYDNKLVAAYAKYKKM